MGVSRALVARLRDEPVITVEGTYSEIMQGRLKDHAAAWASITSKRLFAQHMLSYVPLAGSSMSSKTI